MALRKAVTAVVCVVTLALPVANALAVARATRAIRKKVVSLVTVTGPLVKVGGGYGQHPWGYLELRLVLQKTVVTGASGKVTVSIRIPAMNDISWPVSPNSTSRTIYIDNQALPALQQLTFQTIQAPIGPTSLQNVSGASNTTAAWITSLQGALARVEKP